VLYHTSNNQVIDFLLVRIDKSPSHNFTGKSQESEAALLRTLPDHSSNSPAAAPKSLKIDKEVATLKEAMDEASPKALHQLLR
jgi:hypothetical protein